MAKKRDVYLLSNGQPITEGSVSELCGILSKPALVPWAAKCTVQALEELWQPGQAYTAPYITEALKNAKNAHRVAKDTAGDIGTRAHSIVGAYVEGQLLPENVPDERERRCLENFINVTEGWKWLGSEITVVNEWCECGNNESYQSHKNCTNMVKLSECPQLCGYGGTADAFAQLPSGMYVLPDFKTSNSVQATYSMQCTLYAKATPVGDSVHLAELWKKIKEARILHLDKELLTWECLERNIEEHVPFIPHFIGCRRWVKRFEKPSYSEYKK